MKRVILEKPRNIEGKPLRVPDRDTRGDVKTDNEGQPIMKDATLIDLIRVLIFGMPLDKLTMQDSINAHRLVKQLSNASDGFVEIEEAEHDWLKKKVDDFGPRVFGINACILKDALDNFERLHQPKEPKRGKGKHHEEDA